MGLRDFLTFLAIIGPRPKGGYFAVDRINNDAHYSCGHCAQCEENWWPMNVRWPTRSQSNANTRQRRVLVVNGQKLSLSEWSKITGVSPATILNRLAGGWTEEEAILTPPRKGNYGRKNRRNSPGDVT
jgi:hypothetical protein